jgi:hypothetical protein
VCEETRLDPLYPRAAPEVRGDLINEHLFEFADRREALA